MTYLALARKYRPETFADVVGQDHVTATLRAAHRKGKLSHAYLFSGPRGCGKTTVARLLAKLLNCPAAGDGDPCGVCDTCRGIAQSTFLDVLEIDAASHTGVDNVRELRERAQYAPGKGHNRVFIIDEVHMLSKGAFNALLKILEEPPTRVFFFFATTEPNKIPRTILSRCQRFDFRLLNRDELGARLTRIAAQEGVELDPSGQRVLVSLAEGSMRDGISLLDQAVASCGERIEAEALLQLFGIIRSEIYLDLNDAVLAGDAAAALRLVDEVIAGGQSLDAFAHGLVMNFRNLMLVRVDPELGRTVDLPPDQLERLQAQARQRQLADLMALVDRAAQSYERIHRSTQPRVLLEAAVVEFCHFESRIQLGDLLRRLDSLTAAGPAGGGAAPAHRPGSGSRGGPGSGAPRRGTGGARGGAASRGGESPARGRAAGTGRTDGDDADGPAPSAALGAASTIAGWTELVRALMETHPGLAACLMEGLPCLDEAAGRLTLAFAADRSFQLRRLESDLTVVEETMAAVWGRKLRVQLVLADAGRDPREVSRLLSEVAPSDREVLAAACREDGPLGDLVEMLGGEPLPESERERWRATTAAADPQETAAPDVTGGAEEGDPEPRS
ncbi:MAG: DNA polymerase III subunit gamma/tau [Candidatus Krumholzibacteriia bacterium]